MAIDIRHESLGRATDIPCHVMETPTTKLRSRRNSAGTIELDPAGLHHVGGVFSQPWILLDQLYRMEPSPKADSPPRPGDIEHSASA